MSAHIPAHQLFDPNIDLSELPGVSALSTMEAAPMQDGLSDWQRARLGMITGSNFHKVTYARNGSDWSETALTYMYDIIWEHVAGQPASEFSGSRATEWGNEWEQVAIDEYSRRSGNKVQQGKFFTAPGFCLVGGTPDGVGDLIGLEIKCPLSFKNHARTVITKTVPKEYMPQVQGHMLCTGKEKCVFVSFDPRIDESRPNLRMAVVEVEYEPHVIKELRDRLLHFEATILEELDRLGVEPLTPVLKNQC